VNYSACLHGIDAGNVRLRRDERHNALWIELSDDDVDIPVDLNDKGTLGRDLDGLCRLAEIAAQAAQELEQLQQENGQ
jgi:hypothetical protein